MIDQIQSQEAGYNTMYSEFDLMYRGLSFKQGHIKQNLKQNETKKYFASRSYNITGLDKSNF